MTAAAPLRRIDLASAPVGRLQMLAGEAAARRSGQHSALISCRNSRAGRESAARRASKQVGA